MTFDPTKPVQTRDGRKARVLCVDRKGDIYSIVGLVTSPNGRENPETWRDNGYVSVNSPNDSDLINIPETKSWWVNVYDDEVSKRYSSKDRAEEAHHPSRIALLEIRMCDGKHVETIQHDVEGSK